MIYSRLCQIWRRTIILIIRLKVKCRYATCILKIPMVDEVLPKNRRHPKKQ